MPRILPFVLAATAIAAAACSGSRAEPTSTPTPRPTATPEPPPVYYTRWAADDLPIPYCITLTTGYVAPAEFQSVVQQAFDAWGIEAIGRGSCSSSLVDKDGENQIGWGSLSDGSDEFYEAGLTTRYAPCDNDCTFGEEPLLNEADIQIDPDAPSYYRSTRCLLSVVVHEVGHFLGLEHLPAPAVMETGGSSCGVDVTALDRRALDARYGPLGDGRDLAADDELAVTELIALQFDLFQEEDWETLYPLYSKAYRDSCPYAQFVANNQTSDPTFDPTLLSFDNLTVTISGDTATATYDYLYDGEVALSIDAAAPDRYVKTNGRWYDDVDVHTSCE